MSKVSLVLLAVVSFAACSNGSPTAPSAEGILSAARGGVSSAPGVYELSFLEQVGGVWTEVETLPVLREVLVRAYVSDSTGQPATAGSVTIQYCSYGGVKNDIHRADEAPMEACSAGTATWVRLMSRSVTAGACPDFGAGFDQPGYVCVNFGIVTIPRTVGFRAVYQPRSSGIAGGTTAAENFTWY
jgi:hypothetical protein